MRKSSLPAGEQRLSVSQNIYFGNRSMLEAWAVRLSEREVTAGHPRTSHPGLQGYIFGAKTILKGMGSPKTAAEADDSYRVDCGGRC